MVILYILYFVIFTLVAIVGLVCIKIKSAGINVTDFLKFVKAINNLDSLYIFSKNTTKMTKYEQTIFLKEAEKIFDIFDKIPSIIWEDEYSKYEQVLETYKSIRVLNWAEANV